MFKRGELRFAGPSAKGFGVVCSIDVSGTSQKVPPLHPIPPEESTEIQGVVSAITTSGVNTIAQVGSTIAGRYRLVAPIGEGGMGHVWLATHTDLGQQLALKILHKEVNENPEVRERFRREAMAAVRLRHPGIVQGMDFGTLDDGRSFLAMEYVEGSTLESMLAHGPLPWKATCKLALDIADALAFAHDSGVIHRDLKPSNLILSNYSVHAPERLRARVLDLGIARQEGLGVSQLTQSGTLLGTPSYAAPEQLRGATVTGQSDVFSLGVVLYRALTGRLPFTGRGFPEVAQAQLKGPPPPIDSLNSDPGRPRALDALVMRMLRIKPEERPASAHAVRDELIQMTRSPDRGDEDKTMRTAIMIAAIGLGVGVLLGAATAVAVVLLR